MWNASVSEAVTANGGYGLNVGPGVTLPDAATPYLVTPQTPNCVYAGDPGQPASFPTYDDQGNVTGSIPNSNGPVPYTTQFLLFPDEATAKSCLSDLWVNDATV